MLWWLNTVAAYNNLLTNKPVNSLREPRAQFASFLTEEGSSLRTIASLATFNLLFTYQDWTEIYKNKLRLWIYIQIVVYLNLILLVTLTPLILNKHDMALERLMSFKIWAMSEDWRKLQTCYKTHKEQKEGENTKRF